MPSLIDDILTLIAAHPGATDREITDQLRGKQAPQQAVNQACRSLEARGRLRRQRRQDGKIGNYPGAGASIAQNPVASTDPEVPPGVPDPVRIDALAEDRLKQVLKRWLESRGWDVQVAWAKSRGVDLIASRKSEKWIIEVKGRGSLDPMRVNYFLCVLGEMLQRMDNAEARYSIALPDLRQFRGLWARLPSLAKARTQISALFVGEDGSVSEDP